MSKDAVKMQSASPTELVIYVSPQGDDRWSGTLPEAAGDRRDGPLATLERARDLVRSAVKPKRGAVRVCLRGGTYALPAPLVLGPEDSGTSDCPVIYAAYPGEKPVLYGGRRLTDWTPDGDRCWSASAPGTATGAWDFHRLYVNGEARPIARLPETGTWRHASTFEESYNPCFDPPPSVEKRSKLVYQEGQLPADFALKNAEFVVLHSWDDSHTWAVAHDPATRTLRLDPACTYPPGMYGVKEYYVLNLREGMTKPGQWYLDRECERVIYWSLPGEEPNNCNIEAPFLPSLLRMEGSGAPVWKDDVPGQGTVITRMEGGLPVANITLSGLTFDLTAVELVGPQGGIYGGSSYPGASDKFSVGVWSEFFTGAVMLRHARNCRLSDLTVRRSSGQGIKIVHADNTTVERCNIAHAGANGIAFNFGAHNAIVSNRVRHVGELYNFAVGIHGINWSYGRIAHNEVFDCAYCGITLSNGNRKDPLPAENVVEYNHVYNVMNALNDGGCIYFSWSQRGTVVRGNTLHGAHGRTGNGNGLYLDIGVEGVTCERNLVYDIADRVLHVHMASNNLIRNNVFVCGSRGGISFIGSDACVFERNIVLGTQRDIQFYNPVGARFAGNLYWSTVGMPRFTQSHGMWGSQPFSNGLLQEADRFALLFPLSEVSGPPNASDWEGAKVVRLAVDARGNAAPSCHRTEVRFLRQDDILHARFRIIERPAGTRLVNERETIWAREHCGLFLKPFPARSGVVHLGVSPSGETATLGISGTGRFGWSASTQDLDGNRGWESVLRIPLAELAAAFGGGTPAPTFLAYSKFENPAMDFVGWQASDRDPDGMVADPLFVDPSAGDFRLCESSPASKWGFVPLDLTVVGPKSAREKE